MTLNCKILQKSLIKAQEEIQKYKDEKVQLEHLLLLKVEEIVKLENKIVEFEKKSEETYATVVKKKLSSNRLSLPSNHILSARLINSHEKISTKTLSEQAFSKCKKTNPQEKYKKKTQVEITEKNIFSNNIYDFLRQDNDDNDEVGYVEDLEPKDKILICSDSHGKDLAWYLNNKHSLNSVGFVRQGGRAEQILNMDNINGEVVSKKDFLVIMCGTNDVARNKAEVLINNITNTLESVKEKKVILVDLPNRYDLAEWSCVNKETRKTDLVLKELSNGFGNVSLVEASVATKDMHTKHGMHFNAKGKDWLAGKIDEAVKSYSTRPPSAMDLSSAGEPSTEHMLQPTVETLT
ncbi:hypothetical protein J6590_010535 [Homalodisca vitripennis]|nr:hypothetical protein J6590_010535 [Homalodisca vitripennis]